MRTAFINTLCEAADKDKRVWLLCADLGYSVLETFLDKFPERFLNVGVAEQDMICNINYQHRPRLMSRHLKLDLAIR